MKLHFFAVVAAAFISNTAFSHEAPLVSSPHRAAICAAAPESDWPWNQRTMDGGLAWSEWGAAPAPANDADLAWSEWGVAPTPSRDDDLA